jgi:hypothetical protein
MIEYRAVYGALVSPFDLYKWTVFLYDNTPEDARAALVTENNDEEKEGEEKRSTPSRSNSPSLSARHATFVENFLRQGRDGRVI